METRRTQAGLIRGMVSGCSGWRWRSEVAHCTARALSGTGKWNTRALTPGDRHAGATGTAATLARLRADGRAARHPKCD